jgi:hypothetical protein
LRVGWMSGTPWQTDGYFLDLLAKVVMTVPVKCVSATFLGRPETMRFPMLKTRKRTA